MLQASKAPPCRFLFYVIIVLRIIVEAVETVRRFRRRGKALVSTPFVQATNMHNEYGLVAVERKMPVDLLRKMLAFLVYDVTKITASWLEACRWTYAAMLYSLLRPAMRYSLLQSQ